MFFICSNVQIMSTFIDTLGKAVRHQMLIVAECRQCGRQARFLASDLVQFYGHGRIIQSLPFKCRECGIGGCKILPVEHQTERVHEVVVWRPVKIK